MRVLTSLTVLACLATVACSGSDGQPASMASFMSPTATAPKVQNDLWCSGCGDEQQLTPMSVVAPAAGAAYLACIEKALPAAQGPYDSNLLYQVESVCQQQTATPPPVVGVPHDPHGCRGQDCAPAMVTNTLGVPPGGFGTLPTPPPPTPPQPCFRFSCRGKDDATPAGVTSPVGFGTP